MPTSNQSLRVYIEENCFPGYLLLSSSVQEDFEKTLFGRWLFSCVALEYPAEFVPFQSKTTIQEDRSSETSTESPTIPFLVGRVFRWSGRALWAHLRQVASSNSVMHAVLNTLESTSSKIAVALLYEPQWQRERKEFVQQQLGENVSAHEALGQAIGESVISRKQALIDELTRQHAWLCHYFHDAQMIELLNVYCVEAVRSLKKRLACCASHQDFAQIDPSQVNFYVRGALQYLRRQVLPSPIAMSPLVSAQASLTTLFSSRQFRSIYFLLKKVASSHAMIQYLGFSTQNESSWLAGLDLYNYWEYGEDIAAVKGIVASIIRTFYPLAREYQDIAKYEKHKLLKMIRVLVPPLILAVLFVAVLTPLALIGVPELALFVVSIPLLFLGLYLASVYVSVKDRFIDKMRLIYYGEEDRLPEYAVNERMLALFALQADVVREKYLLLLKGAQKKKAYYERQIKLTDAQIKDKRETMNLMTELMLEWVDIHDNPDCVVEAANRIVQERFAHVHNTLLQVSQADLTSVCERAASQFSSHCLTGLPSQTSMQWGRFWSRKAQMNREACVREGICSLGPKKAN